MRRSAFLPVFSASLVVAACASNDFTAEITSRGVLSDYHIADIAVNFAPNAQLEWCEDNLWQCDMVELRITQTFEAGVRAGAVGMQGAKAARLDIMVDKFDSITLLSRMTVGGVHDIDAAFRLVDAETGAEIASHPMLDFDRIAWGRTAGVIANLMGRTQRVRIAERIANVTRQWLVAISGRPV